MTHKGASPTPAVLPGDTGKDIHGTNAYQKVPDYALEISGKVFKQISILNNIWNSFWIIFRQAYLQIIFPATISQFLDPLFLWPMYCHFGPCRTQSGSEKTF